MFGVILFAVDDLPHTVRAARTVRELAGATGDAVVVVHVQEFTTSRAGTYTFDEYDESSQAVAERVRELSEAGVSATSEMRQCLRGGVAQELLAAVAEHAAGLVVVGSQGATDIASLLLGSVPHRMVHLAHVPVLVVREEAALAERTGE